MDTTPDKDDNLPLQEKEAIRLSLEEEKFEAGAYDPHNSGPDHETIGGYIQGFLPRFNNNTDYSMEADVSNEGEGMNLILYHLKSISAQNAQTQKMIMTISAENRSLREDVRRLTLTCNSTCAIVQKLTSEVLALKNATRQVNSKTPTNNPQTKPKTSVNKGKGKATYADVGTTPNAPPPPPMKPNAQQAKPLFRPNYGGANREVIIDISYPTPNISDDQLLTVIINAASPTFFVQAKLSLE